VILALVAVAAAVQLKRGSVFRDRPQPTEGEVLVSAFKTILMIFGAALLATVLLQAVVDRPEPDEPFARPPAPGVQAGAESEDS
jgi:hypothetical protein